MGTKQSSNGASPSTWGDDNPQPGEPGYGEPASAPKHPPKQTKKPAAQQAKNTASDWGYDNPQPGEEGYGEPASAYDKNGKPLFDDKGNRIQADKPTKQGIAYYAAAEVDPADLFRNISSGSTGIATGVASLAPLPKGKG